MINTQDVLETIQMIREENLDIRTVTMGISLWDCVSEDTDRLCTKIYDKITRQAERGALTLEKLEAMTAVCSVGLDMIAIPGDTPAEVISGIIADEAAIGVVNSKTTAVRLIPAIGCREGDTVSFGGLLGEAPVIRVNGRSPAEFIARGGRIPAPIQSLKN